MSTTGHATDKKSTAAGDGVPLDYAVAGAGEPLVLLHGLFAGRAAFSRQIELGDSWRLIMPSTRAHDGADGRLPTGYGIDTTECDDLCRVLDAEGLDRFHLLGHSSGGALAFALARRLPDRVRRMVLVEPTLFGIMAEPARGDIRATFRSFAETGEKRGDRAGLAHAIDWLGGEAWQRLGPDRQAARLDAMMPMAHLVIPHFRALAGFPITPEDVRGVTVPTLLVYGAQTYPMEFDIAAAFRALRPDWPQHIIDGAGHNCFRDKAAEANAAIRRFLSE